MFKSLALITLAGLALASTTAQAREFGDIYKECGIGAMIFPAKDDQTLAVITNVTWDSGTTAVSSDASSDDLCKGGQVAAASLIHHNYPALENDFAQGKGDHANALVSMMGCDTAVQADVINAVRQDYSSIVGAQDFASQTQYQKSEDFYNMVNQRLETSFTNSCSIS